jgi:MFS transporter, putative metabolite:H+ symporter
VWMTLSFGFYGIFTFLPTLESRQGVVFDIYTDNLFVAAASVPGNLVASLIVDRVGRRWVVGGAMALAAGSVLLFALSRSPVVTIIAASCLNSLSNAAWVGLDALTTESFPTELRATTGGALGAVGRLASLTAQLVFSALLAHPPALLGISAAVVASGAAAAFFVTETAHKRLQDRVA